MLHFIFKKSTSDILSINIFYFNEISRPDRRISANSSDCIIQSTEDFVHTHHDTWSRNNPTTHQPRKLARPASSSVHPHPEPSSPTRPSSDLRWYLRIKMTLAQGSSPPPAIVGVQIWRLALTWIHGWMSFALLKVKNVTKIVIRYSFRHLTSLYISLRTY